MSHDRYIVHVTNHSPFPLTYSDAALDRGTWVQKPPPQIAPNETGRWEAITAQRGIEPALTIGSVRYDVDLTMSNVPSAGAGVTFTWLGADNGQASFKSSLGATAGRLISGDFSSQFLVDDSDATTERREPIIDVIADRISVSAQVRMEAGSLKYQPLHVTLPPSHATELVAISSPSGWNGNWAERDLAPTRILVSVNKNKDVFDVTVRQQSDVNFQKAGIVIAKERVPSYTVDHLPWVDPAPPSGPSVIPLPDGARLPRPVIDRRGSSIGSIGGAFTGFVEVLPVREDIRIQLYDERNAATHQHERFRVRYLRRDAGGHVVADVMLVSNQPIF
jgi:hypothetical protein